MNELKKKKTGKTVCFLAGLSLGLFAAVFGLAFAGGVSPENNNHLTEPMPQVAVSPYDPSDSEGLIMDDLACEGHFSIAPSQLNGEQDSIAGGIYSEWNAESVYTGGDKVLYQGRVYRAKWWTLGERPGISDVWEDTGAPPSSTTPLESTSAPMDTDRPWGDRSGGFRVVGYFPSWKPQAAASIRYDVLTHVIYAFAIPTAEGGLRPLENGETAASIIRTAHEQGVKVLLAVGGWSYNGTPLENTFVQATATAENRAKLADAILNLCDTYGFDGVDMDWEHPRVDGASAAQYEALMLTLSESLHNRGKLLTSAVLSGATADGNIYYDAAAHSNAVLEAVDWIHVMAYDGGDGDRHSQYQFAVRSAEYWHDKRGMPGDKVVLGVPFYARPSWAGYGDILAAVPDAWSTDCVTYNGMQVWYNGVDTIRAKTRYALEHLGGVMIWEISQDAAAGEKSLITAICSEISAQTAFRPAHSFKDVSVTAYYADAVQWAVASGITNGTSDTTFSPDAPCTRAQIVTFLWRAAGSPNAAGGNPFTDVPANAYSYEAVLWAVENGITNGTSDTTFSPDATVTRGQTVTFLWRAGGSPAASGGSFADVEADAYYAPAVQWAATNGITNGTGSTTFNPDAPCTRGQIVTFMYRGAQ